MASVSFVTLLTILVAFTVIGFGTMNGINGVAMGTMRSTQRNFKAATAQNLAESGIYMTFQWLHQIASTQNLAYAGPPSQFAPSGSTFYGATTVGGYNVLSFTEPSTGLPLTVSVRIYPYQTNLTSFAKAYVVESIGTYQGTQRIVRACFTQRTLAFYGVLYNSWANGLYFSAGGDIVNGPIHINGVNSSNVVDPSIRVGIEWKTAGPQIFQDPTPESFTTSLPPAGLKWWVYGSSSTERSPATAAEWLAVSAAGQGPITSAPVVAFPSTTAQQLTVALGSLSAIPSGVGVTVPNTSGIANGGILINGDVTDMVLSATGTSNTSQVITLRQNDTSINKTVRSTITINPVANTTSIKVEQAPLNTTTFTTISTTDYTGATNNVVYLNGNIGDTTAKTGGIRGVIAENILDGTGNYVVRYNKLYIVTEGTKNLRVQGSIVHSALITNSSNANNIVSSAITPTYRCGIVGLTANNVPLARYDAGGTEITNFCFHATVLATNNCNPEDYSIRTGGSFTQIGGFLVKTAQAFSTSSGKGLGEFHYYDYRMVNNPPPYFPVANSNYLLTSLQSVSSTIE